MKSLADALVYAVAYIDICDDRDGDFLDDDVGALESIVGFLNDATTEEQDALAEAAQRALHQERASRQPRAKFIRAYENWMEETFGPEDWQGNRRRTNG